MTRKITSGAAKIALGKESKLRLGNLDARRDWGHAAEYVQAMWLMLQRDQPDDYVIATGTCHTVAEFVAAAFATVELDWRQHVVSDASLYRSAESHALRGDASKAEQDLGWRSKTSFSELVKEMMTADLIRHAARPAATAIV